jgi:hypothetical protein
MEGYYTYPGGDALTPSTFHHDVSGSVYPAQVVVENRATYFDHEDRIKSLEKRLEAMILEKRRQLFFELILSTFSHFLLNFSIFSAVQKKEFLRMKTVRMRVRMRKLNSVLGMRFKDFIRMGGGTQLILLKYKMTVDICFNGMMEIPRIGSKQQISCERLLRLRLVFKSGLK